MARQRRVPEVPFGSREVKRARKAAMGLAEKALENGNLMLGYRLLDLFHHLGTVPLALGEDGDEEQQPLPDINELLPS